MDDPARQQANLARQVELYGAPLGDSVGSVAERLDLSQAAVARVLGVSAPMLSQLVTGQRIKLGNPQAVQRLQALIELAEETDRGLPHSEVAPRLAQIGESSGTTLTQARVASTAATAGAELPAAFSRLLRAVASGREISAAASVLAEEHPELAELLRVYGTGRLADQQRHFARFADLV